MLLLGTCGLSVNIREVGEASLALTHVHHQGDPVSAAFIEGDSVHCRVDEITVNFNVCRRLEDGLDPKDILRVITIEQLEGTDIRVTASGKGEQYFVCTDGYR